MDFISHIKRELMTPPQEFSWITYNWLILKSLFKSSDDTWLTGELVNLVPKTKGSQRCRGKKIGVGKAGVGLLPHKK